MKKSAEQITYGMHDTPFGPAVIAQSDKGLCWLGFMVKGYKGDGFERLRGFYPNADLVHDDTATAPLMAQILDAWERDALRDIPLDLRGTDFQLSVWDALLDIRKGDVESYGDIAAKIDRPKASRAVGSAVGSNPVSLIVPCHRVVQGSGKIGNYGWGCEIKRALLAAENVKLAA